MRLARTALSLLLFALLFSACNSIEDIKHLTQNEMLKYVQDRIGEEVALVSVEGDETGDGQMTYIFNVVARDINFEVTARKWVGSLDGMRMGNYELVIHVKYEGGIVKHFQKESAELAERYNVEYKVNEHGGG